MQTLFLFFSLQVAFLAGAGEKKPACCVTNSVTANVANSPEFTDKSLYELDSVWISAVCGNLILAELKG